MNTSSNPIPVTEKEEALKLLNHIQKISQINQRTLSNKLGISLGKVNFLIKEFSKKGWLKVKKATHSDNKLQYLYILTPEGIKQKGILTRKFLNRKIEEYNRLEKEIIKLKNQIDV